MYLDSAKKKELLKSMANQQLTLVLLRAKSHCSHSVSLT